MTEQDKITIRNIQDLGRKISEKYLGEPWDIAADSAAWAVSSLRLIISRVFKETEDFVTCCDAIRKKLMQYPGIYDLVDFQEIVRDITIRRNFDKALRGVTHGSDLSYKLGYGFSKDDLKELAKLHKVGKHREKIEDLLTDCNFHEESAAMESSDYSMFGI
jgi:hypothetical protein